MDVRIVVTFIDRSGNLSTLTATPPQEAAHAAILVGAQRLCEKLDAVSTAEVLKAKVIYVDTDFSFGPPEPDSDVFERFIALFREDDEWGSISIPSVGALPFDEDGPYRHVRVTREALVLSGMLASLEDLASGTVRQDGTSFPTTFYVGGRTRIKP